MNESKLVIPTTEEIDRVRGYKVGKWHENDNYSCLDCMYETLWEQKMIGHVAEEVHPWPFPDPARSGELSKLEDEDALTY